MTHPARFAASKAIEQTKSTFQPARLAGRDTEELINARRKLLHRLPICAGLTRHRVQSGQWCGHAHRLPDGRRRAKAARVPTVRSAHPMGQTDTCGLRKIDSLLLTPCQASSKSTVAFRHPRRRPHTWKRCGGAKAPLALIAVRTRRRDTTRRAAPAGNAGHATRVFRRLSGPFSTTRILICKDGFC